MTQLRLQLRQHCLENGWLTVAQLFEVNEPFRVTHGILSDELKPNIWASVAHVIEVSDWETVALLFSLLLLVLVALARTALDIVGCLTQNRQARHQDVVVTHASSSPAPAALNVARVPSGEQSGQDSYRNIERQSEILQGRTSRHEPFSSSELDRAVKSITNILGPASQHVDFTRLRSVFREWAHTSHSVRCFTSSTIVAGRTAELCMRC